MPDAAVSEKAYFRQAVQKLLDANKHFVEAKALFTAFKIRNPRYLTYQITPQEYEATTYPLGALHQRRMARLDQLRLQREQQQQQEQQQQAAAAARTAYPYPPPGYLRNSCRTDENIQQYLTNIYPNRQPCAWQLGASNLYQRRHPINQLPMRSPPPPPPLPPPPMSSRPVRSPPSCGQPRSYTPPPGAVQVPTSPPNPNFGQRLNTPPGAPPPVEEEDPSLMGLSFEEELWHQFVAGGNQRPTDSFMARFYEREAARNELRDQAYQQRDRELRQRAAAANRGGASTSTACQPTLGPAPTARTPPPRAPQDCGQRQTYSPRNVGIQGVPEPEYAESFSFEYNNPYPVAQQVRCLDDISAPSFASSSA